MTLITLEYLTSIDSSHSSIVLYEAGCAILVFVRTSALIGENFKPSPTIIADINLRGALKVIRPIIHPRWPLQTADGDCAGVSDISGRPAALATVSGRSAQHLLI